MSKSVRATFAYPTTRVGGGFLDPADIEGCAVGMRVVGAPTFTELEVVPYPAMEFVQTDLSPGMYEFSFLCVLKNGLRSATQVVRSILILDDSPPDSIKNVVLTVE